jgi:hypothetical protein
MGGKANVEMENCMPLKPGSSEETISTNIREMQAAGHPHDVAIAAALDTARKHRADGGVTADKAREIAHEVVGMHVNRPAPEGHKGLEKVMPRAHREHGGLNMLHVPKIHSHKIKAPHAFKATKHHTGPIHSSVAGRTDHLPIHVPSGSYVIPADIVSGMGEGNTIAGFKHIKRMFGGTPYGNRGGGPYGQGSAPYGMAAGGAAKEGSVSAEDALKYRQLAGAHSIATLEGAFHRAIAHHLSLDDETRKTNSRVAKTRVGKFTGTASGVPDLLQKNAKMMKSEKGVEGKVPIQLPDGRGVETTGLALAPAYQEKGFATCSNFKSCAASCLGLTSGGNWMFGGGRDLDALKGPRLAHFKNTMAMLGDPEAFAVKLHDEIGKAKASAAANGNKLGVRLNVLSDIHPRVHKSIINAHPDVDFYDYTKSAANPIAPNHHYTYSSTGVSQPAGINGLKEGVVNPHQNWSRMRGRLDAGQNVAMAFSSKGHAGDDHLPQHVHDHETGKHYRVVDGDTHDYRPLDRQPEGSPGVIVGLRNKAQNTAQTTASNTSNGFFVHHTPKPAPGHDWAAQMRQQNVVDIAPQTTAHTALTNDLKPDIGQ